MGFKRYLTVPLPCTHCGGVRVRIGQTAIGTQKYLCKGCLKLDSDRTDEIAAARAAARAARELRKAKVLLRKEAPNLFESIQVDYDREIPAEVRRVLKEFIPSREVLKIRGFTRQRLNVLIHEHRLLAIEHQGTWWVYKPSALMYEPRPRGRKKASQGRERVFTSRNH